MAVAIVESLAPINLKLSDNCTFRQLAYFLPSASRGLQCPDGVQGFGEDELEAYCRNTRPSVHLSHKDPTSLGNQHIAEITT